MQKGFTEWLKQFLGFNVQQPVIVANYAKSGEI